MTRALGAFLVLLAAGVLSGALVAALVMPPLVGGSGVVKQGADSFLALPADFAAPVLPKRSQILAADGTLIAWLYEENRVPVTLDQVPEVTQQAVLAIEDSRFYEHNGVDVKGVARAAAANATSGEVDQGASTLTQQYVKNALAKAAKTPAERRAAVEVSMSRKIREARYALALEKKLSKDEILERYLNIAYYGNGVYGIGTAANYYFSKPVGELTVAESALLAGVVQSPTRHDPVDNPDSATSRRNAVISRMHEVGYITSVQRDEALAAPLGLKVRAVGSGCEAPNTTAPFFCDYVRRVLEDTPVGTALGETKEERQRALHEDGLTIKTTLHPGMQKSAVDTVHGMIPQNDPSGVATTFTAVRPGTGEVVALAVNRTFGEDEVPGQTKLNLPLGGSSGMQAGSAFKPFVLAAALRQGLPLNTTFDSPGEYTSKVFKNCSGQSCDDFYTVRNAGDSNNGRHDLVSGTRNSVNTFYLQLLEKTGVEEPAQIAEAFGLRQFKDGAPTAPLHRGGSFVLGVNEVSPVDMAAAYAGLAARGLYCPPRAVTGIFEADGTEIPIPKHECKQVLDPRIVDQMASIMRGTVDGPWSKTAARASIGRPVAGKTGTTNGSKAAWFVGWAPQMAAAVWVGKPVPVPLQNVTINGQRYRQVYGGTIPAQTWSLVMGHILRNAPVADLPPPAVSAPTPAAPPG